MLSLAIDLYSQLAKWLNDNQGVVGLAIFIATVGFGWLSGIFSALRRKPKFKVSLIEGPTFCCTYPTGNINEGFDAHRTGIALYLRIANIGSASSSVENISVGYHWHLRPFSSLWLRFTVGWFWLTDQTAALADFQVKIGENIKVYPFLTQKNSLSRSNATTFLDVGRSTNGVVYFEQSESWGGCFPSSRNGKVRIKVRVRDVFGRNHTMAFSVPLLALEEARKYNPSFGKTLVELHGEQLPFDRSI